MRLHALAHLSAILYIEGVCISGHLRLAQGAREWMYSLDLQDVTEDSRTIGDKCKHEQTTKE